MKRFKIGCFLITVLAFIQISYNAFASVPKEWVLARCEEDSLGISQAIGRDQWALNCGHISYRTWDYAMYDDNGDQRTRPYYPTFWNPSNFNDWMKNTPNDPSVDCMNSQVAIYSSTTMCTASCYTPDQMILYDDGEFTIYDALNDKIEGIERKLVALDETSTLNDLSFTTEDVGAYTVSLRDTKHEIYIFKMKSGGMLKVTDNHPLILSTGNIREAENIYVGESLILADDGFFDEIVSIDVIEYFGKVYNVKPKTTSLKGNIIVAQGYLVGSSWYQNSGYQHMERFLLRENIPDDLLVYK